MIRRDSKRELGRARRTRGRLSGSHLPRLSVFRSQRYVYGQIVDRGKGRTLLGGRAKDPKILGQTIAAKAKAAKIGRVVFDRGPYKYHGRVKAVAEAARAAGLKF